METLELNPAMAESLFVMPDKKETPDEQMADKKRCARKKEQLPRKNVQK